MKIITAIDSFKGSLTSAEANSAAARAILRLNSNSNVKSILVSDGGEGWIEACSRIFE
jgi:glycerate kinase